MTRLEYPFCEKSVRALRAGDAVSISGRIYTGRDKLHKHFADGGDMPVDFRDGALYHCGPVVVKGAGGEWRVVSAGPTTSVRENPYEPAFIAATGVRVIIGKGGMGAKTLAACAECGCVYLQAVGGAAALTARRIEAVEDVHFLEEFGPTEAVWTLRCVGLEAIVGMDAHGTSLFDAVRQGAESRLKGLSLPTPP